MKLYAVTLLFSRRVWGRVKIEHCLSMVKARSEEGALGTAIKAEGQCKNHSLDSWIVCEVREATMRSVLGVDAQ